MPPRRGNVFLLVPIHCSDLDYVFPMFISLPGMPNRHTPVTAPVTANPPAKNARHE
ncbi:hypothetical protein ANDA3_3666 [plant metagenome]|uniref:Uncharacterized protein n=2 Tax=root TaxID=1 RepID=A0A1C3K4F9_9BURK|nr:hypothetical protein ODI_04153 [Orrella dioscoreae]SOE46570.1 hypothetical protein ODI_R0355 [Orrella dioscoreae]